MALKPGDKAPLFSAKDQDGKDVRLSDLKGKKVVLYFYPRDMTPGCTAEACSLRDNYRSLMKAGYEVLGISTDSEATHQKFIKRENLPFRLLADTDKAVHSLYGTWIEKSLYGRKYMGTARVTFVIDEKGIIEEVIGKVDTKNHADQILNRASEAPPKSAKSKATRPPQKKPASSRKKPKGK